MKRETFHIMQDDKLVMTKYKWNSALRAARDLVAALATADGHDYHLINSNVVKAGFGHTHGAFFWKSTIGRSVTFTISKVD